MYISIIPKVVYSPDYLKRISVWFIKRDTEVLLILISKVYCDVVVTAITV